MAVDDDDDDSALLRKMMGFTTFKTTQNTKVPGNQIYGVRKEKKTEYRQYMNREASLDQRGKPVACKTRTGDLSVLGRCLQVAAECKVTKITERLATGAKCGDIQDGLETGRDFYYNPAQHGAQLKNL
ncbi:hypothetical protein CLCR_07726 [Cladophialophora carrionii]|uniref:U4/U6.U5 small nuclear ribonucleoprotein 27kDa protein domain-containing protein n=1 Tax=Cladophialophora carrionii TaxID=86049 RepID=A0A1C1CPM9_9EURO|nr:hypothetical protein CLCR_07726 [Cladophialophora carrionii]